MAELKLALVNTARNRFLLVIPALFIALVTLYATFTTYVPPDAFAVKQVYLGPGKGIQKQVLGPGLHVVVPGYEQLHIFPRDIQLMELNDDHTSSSSEAFYSPAIRIQTSEGYQVTVDVTVVFRITDPYKVMTTVGPGRLYETALVAPRSDTFLRQTLGKLNAEQFYDGAARRFAGNAAREKLSADLLPKGIEVWSVLVRHYTYDDRYQEAIEQRKIQDQMVFKNQAEAVAAGQEALKNEVLAEGQAIVEVERERGRSEVRRREAEANLYYRKTVAAGDLEVALADAEGIRLENAALQAAGTANLVGLRMAEVMKGIRVIVIPTDGPDGVNPLDLDELIGGW
jgi:regulator of protease activity HflC (stomatin/prohibitin superfamily)